MKETTIKLKLTRHERRLLRQLVEACEEEPTDEISWLFGEKEDGVRKWTRIAESLHEKVLPELKKADKKDPPELDPGERFIIEAQKQAAIRGIKKDRKR